MDQIENSPDVEFVVGVGIISKIGINGIVGLTRDNLFHDLIFGDLLYSPEDIVKFCLPDLIKGNARVPIFKYLRNSGHIMDENLLICDELDDKIIKTAKNIKMNSFEPFGSYLNHREEIQEYSGIQQLRENYDLTKMLWYIPLLKLDKIDIEEFYKFLLEVYPDFFGANPEYKSYQSQMKKLICMYDWMKYGTGDELKESYSSQREK